MRFLLITEARSGTHMFRGAFRNHPDVFSFADYCSDLVTVRGGLTQFLTELYSKMPADSTSGAFTHFGELRRHSKTEKRGWIPEDWRSLRKIHSHVIALTRRSSLRRYLSLELALKKGLGATWSCDTLRNSDPPPITLDLNKFLAWHQRAKRIRQDISKLLEPYYSVVYEELVSDWLGTMRGIYDYLGLQWDNPKILPFQQETRPLEAIVENWPLISQEAAARNLNLLEISNG